MTIRSACLSMVIFAGFAVALADTASAQGTEEERRACTPDAMRLCREYIPNIDRIVACMVARREELSPACQAFIKPDQPPVAVAAAPARPAARRTAGGKRAAKPRAAKPVIRSSRAAPSRTPARPLNLLPAAAKPAPAKKTSSRNKQAQRTQ
jgi:hypothetical protein